MDKGGITFSSDDSLKVSGTILNGNSYNSNVFTPPAKTGNEPISVEDFNKALDPILAMLTLLYDELQELKKKKEDI